MKRLLERAAEIGRIVQRRKIDELGDLLRAAVPDANIERSGGQIVLSGRRLMRRWLNDASLRFVAGQLR